LCDRLADCQESLRRSFELGVQVGIYRHTRDLLSWSKKRRRRVARDELIAHLCGKAVPTARLRASQSQFAKTPVKSASTSTLGSRFASVDAVEPDLQLFHDALAVHGMSAPRVTRVHTDPGKLRNLKFKFARPLKSWNLV